MRHNFRIKMDFSEMFEDVQQLCWIFIDSTKINYVYQLIEHVRKLFRIKKQFYLMSKFEDMYLFLPFEEDVRVLENNDTVIIFPGVGISSFFDFKNGKSSLKIKNSIDESVKYADKENNTSSEKSYNSLKSSLHNTMENIEGTLSISNNLYTTAMHETNNCDTKSIKMNNDNETENNSISKDDTVPVKRKRVRKKKDKKISDTIAESDTSYTEFSRKKPKIIDSVLIPSGKHIRFKGLDDGDTISDYNITNGNTVEDNKPENKYANHDYIEKDLNNLLSLRQSSTPITFEYRKISKHTLSEPDEKFKLIDKSENSIDISQSNESTGADTIYTFKIFKMGEDYTPQLSERIVAKFLSYDAQDSKYVLKILHGKEQLQEPVGKFSLPEDEENGNGGFSDIVTLEKSKLLELTKVNGCGNVM